jgi:hypothetical protein
MNFKLVVDLAGIQFDDAKPDSSWIQAMTLGKYDHALYGEIEFTEDRINAFAGSVNAKVLNKDIEIDYDHKMYNGEAAGWVSAAEARHGEGLWLLVDWTKAAADKIRSKAYRYFSPEFADEWQHPKTGTKFKDVLFGGGITNRPFLKDILPLNLSDLVGGTMDPKLLRQLLKLSEDATDDAVANKLRELMEPAKPEVDKPKLDDKAELTKLAEENPMIKALVEQNEATQRRLAEVEATQRLSDLTIQLNSLQSSLKNIALSDENLGKVRQFALELPTKDQSRFVTVLGEVLSTVAFLGEIGKTSPAGDIDDGSGYMKAINKLVEDNKGMSFAEAAVEISRTNPELLTAYHNSMGATANG